MRIKENKKKGGIFFLLVFLISFILIYLLISLPGVKRNLEQDFRILFLQPILLKSGNTSTLEAIDGVLTTFKEMTKIKRDYPELKININFLNLDKIKKNKIDAMKKSILFNPEKVNGKIYYNNKKYNAQIRLKGDLEMHWSWNKQYSLRIELEDGETIMGMREFSITQHQSRNFPYTELISKSLKISGLDLLADYVTFKVSVNGENWGIMLAEEQYSSSYLEKRRLIDSPIIKLTNEENWKFFKQIEEVNYNNLDKKLELKKAKVISKLQGVFEINVFNKKKNNSIIRQHRVSKFKNLRELIYLNQIDKDNIENYLDLEKLSKVIASSFIWGDSHSLNSNNMRFYINPFTSKLEPIPTDHSYMFGDYNNFISEFDIGVYKVVYEYLPKIIKISLESDKFKDLYIKEISNYANIIPEIKNIVKEICKIGQKICSKQINIDKVERNYNKMLFYNKDIFKIIKNKNTNTTYNEINIQNNWDEFLKYIRSHLYVRSFSSGKVNFKNLSPFEVKLKEIKKIKSINCYIKSTSQITNLEMCEDKIFKVNKKIKKSIHPMISEINLNFPNLQEGEIFLLRYSINNIDFSYEMIVENQIFSQRIMDLYENKEDYFEILESEKKVKIKKGNWDVKKPIIIPYGFDLEISEGTKLNFKNKSFIRLNSGALYLLGKKENPIFLTSEDTWYGILVINSNLQDKSSIIQYTTFTNLDHYRDENTHLTGSINFYKSNTNISNSKFYNNKSEDFINIVNSDFKIENNTFKNIYSDAIDIDFGNGDLLNSEYINVSGDAIDTSGSQTIIQNNKFANIFDKAISIGEKSSTIIKNNFINKSSIGIAIKDGSQAEINNLNIKFSKISDVMVYNKKSFYNKSLVKINDSDKSLKVNIQNGNDGYYLGNRLSTEDINVKELYN